MHDRHMIWARVTADREQLLPLAPEGYEPVVEIFVHGLAEPIVPAYIETRSDGWIRIQATTPPEEGADGKWEPDDFLLHVPQEAVGRIKIRFRRTEPGHEIGFRFKAAGELESSGIDAD